MVRGGLLIRFGEIGALGRRLAADNALAMPRLLVEWEAARNGLVVLFGSGLAFGAATEPGIGPAVFDYLAEMVVGVVDFVDIAVAEFRRLLEQVSLNGREQFIRSGGQFGLGERLFALFARN